MFYKRSRRRGLRRKKREFSKIWLISCIVLSCVYTTASYVLAAFDKNPVAELSQTIIETLWGTSGVSFIGYAVQNCMRAYTSAKFGIPTEKEEKEDEYADL